MQYVFEPPVQPSVAVRGQVARFPVRRIFCVGRNYAAHIREMGNDERDPPFYFTKPNDAIAESESTLPYPPETQDLHHEVELVLALGGGGENLNVAQARERIWGACVGIDLTRRDLQTEAKSAGHPWDMAKGFDNSAPLGAIVPLSEIDTLDRGPIWLEVNGEPRQDGDLSEMIWSVEECVAHLSKFVTLQPGDLIMTGTPSGVGPVGMGDKLVAGIGDLPEVDITLAAQASA
ncbi:fumarylacetoacetate hydrolase family protein [Litoreibacter roseus]|uniref:Fumarylacetoacetate (FAA) hydrolase n=1 Tax=Litoreibacter roseus TaxID=2601869 RepID=A0A6N6JCG1_9RHOB|nr:fumarylacetoacetate hydrolase family protein [Litoreibacter roseus]GFE63667.1 fumarylacetoacetate (FAA) hydrolase [Litoreibacter roseus]